MVEVLIAILLLWACIPALGFAVEFYQKHFRQCNYVLFFWYWALRGRKW